MNVKLFEDLQDAAQRAARQAHLERCNALGIPAGTSATLVAVFDQLPAYVQDWLRRQLPSQFITVGWLRIEAERWEADAEAYEALPGPEVSLAQMARRHAAELRTAMEIAEQWEVTR